MRQTTYANFDVRSFDSRDGPFILNKHQSHPSSPTNNNKRTTSLMWLLRASTHSQTEVRPSSLAHQNHHQHHHRQKSNTGHRQLMDIFSEALDESVEVSIDQVKIP